MFVSPYNEGIILVLAQRGQNPEPPSGERRDERKNPRNPTQISARNSQVDTVLLPGRTPMNIYLIE